jgi:hypothetical protein
MDAELYKEAIEYELLTQAIYQAIHQKEGIQYRQGPTQRSTNRPFRRGASS